jgi:pimeloyl-ACP methyl ester carboxylesterase
MRKIMMLLLIIIEINCLSAQEISDKASEGFIDNNGVKIHYVTEGEGPLIVMLHGFPDYWYTWRNQMEVLSKNYQVVAIDLRGYNKSDKPKGVDNYKMSHLITDVSAVIKHFPQDKAIVVGHDWGGAIAWQVAMWRPELVERLIVLSTPHPNGLFREMNFNKQQQENSRYAREYQKKDASDKLTAEGLAHWVKDEAAKKYYIEAFNRSDYEAMLNYYKAGFPKQVMNDNNNSRKQKVIITAPRKKIKCSTLAIFGLEDKALLPAGWNGTWDWIDNDFTLVSIPGAGHFVQQDASEKVTRIITMWLKK